MGKTIMATFQTRAEADLAIEHLVEEYGVERADIFVEPQSSENSAGTVASGGDSRRGHSASRPEADAALNGPLVVSVDANMDETGKIEKALRDAGAQDLSSH